MLAQLTEWILIWCSQWGNRGWLRFFWTRHSAEPLVTEKTLEHLRDLEGFPGHTQLRGCPPKPVLSLESEIVSTASVMVLPVALLRYTFCFLLSVILMSILRPLSSLHVSSYLNLRTWRKLLFSGCWEWRWWAALSEGHAAALAWWHGALIWEVLDCSS